MKEIESCEFVLGGEFNDFDQFTEATRAWDLDFYQLEKGGFSASLMQMGLARTQLGEAKFSRSLEQFGMAPRGMRTFVIQAPGVPPMKWRGFDVGENDILIFPRNPELESVSQGGFHIFTFSIAEEELVKTGETLGLCQIEDFLNSGIEVLTPDRVALRSLQTACGEALNRSEVKGELGGARMLGSQIPVLLVEALVGGVSSRASHDYSRVRSLGLKRALDLANDHCHHPLTVEKVCQETGVKARTLQYAFREHYGLSPKQWLKLRALNEVRKELRKSDPAVRGVSDVANKWGLWHMGQLAKDYRQLFGELPSATLNRAR